MAKFETAETIINDVLLECGLPQVTDPFSSGDPAVRQMAGLLTTVGRQLVQLHPWEVLQKEYVIVTSNGDSGKYNLPFDFDRIINVTGWSRTQNLAIPGSVSPYVWQYLRGRNLASSSIYLVYREANAQFWVYPQPPDGLVPDGIEIAFEYISRNWMNEAGTFGDRVTAPGQTVSLDPLLVSRFLKYRFKESRGENSQAAQNEFLQVFNSVAGHDTSGEMIDVGGHGVGLPYIDTFRNLPDSGFGL